MGSSGKPEGLARSQVSYGPGKRGCHETGIRATCQRSKDQFCSLPSGRSLAFKCFLFCVRVGTWELWPVRVLGVIASDLSCYCNS